MPFGRADAVEAEFFAKKMLLPTSESQDEQCICPRYHLNYCNTVTQQLKTILLNAQQTGHLLPVGSQDTDRVQIPADKVLFTSIHFMEIAPSSTL